MGIKLLRGTIGRNGRRIFSRELIDFETEFERVWQINDDISPVSLGNQIIPKKEEEEIMKRKETPNTGEEPVIEPLPRPT